MAEIVVVNTNDLPWEDPPPDAGYHAGVKWKILYKDAKTGAMAALLRVSKGVVSDDVHAHPRANSHALGLSGEIEGPQGERIPQEGVYGFVPRGVKHGGTKVTKEGVVFMLWDGPR